MGQKVKVAIIGSGNVGMDLYYKVLKSRHLEIGLVTNNVFSENLQRLNEMNVPVSTNGIQAIIEQPECAEIVFDATTAKAHVEHAKILKNLQKVAIDMTPARVGVQVVPAVNLEEHLYADNINLISCGGQAVVPIIKAISECVPISYVEGVNTSASKVVGMGTRENVDEYTQHTGEAMKELGVAGSAKALIVINPAEPPIPMHNTIFAVCEKLNEQIAENIECSIQKTVVDIQKYVPGYVMTTQPQFDFERRLVTVMVEVTGAGDFLPEYAGNLDIITQAAIITADKIAERMIQQ